MLCQTLPETRYTLAEHVAAVDTTECAAVLTVAAEIVEAGPVESSTAAEQVVAVM